MPEGTNGNGKRAAEWLGRPVVVGAVTAMGVALLTLVATYFRAPTTEEDVRRIAGQVVAMRAVGSEEARRIAERAVQDGAASKAEFIALKRDVLNLSADMKSFQEFAQKRFRGLSIQNGKIKADLRRLNVSLARMEGKTDELYRLSTKQGKDLDRLIAMFMSRTP